MITYPGIPVESQVARERRAVKSEKLVPVGDAPLVSSPNGAVSCCFGLHRLSVLFKPGQYFTAIMDLQDAVNFGGVSVVGPAGFEYDSDDVFARLSVVEFRNGVADGLVVVERLGFREDFAAGGAWEDIVSEREEEVGIGRNIGFMERPRWVFVVRVGEDEGDDGVVGGARWGGEVGLDDVGACDFARLGCEDAFEIGP